MRRGLCSPLRRQVAAPSGDSTEVPNRPSRRARIRFLAKSFGVGSLRPLHAHAVGVGADDHRIGGQHMTHACGLAHGGHDGHTEEPTAHRVVGQAQVCHRVGGRQRPLHAFRAYSGVGCDLTARTCNSDVGTWSQCNGVPDEVLADNRCTVDGASALVPSVPSIFVGDIGAMPSNESRRGLSPECNEAESSAVRGYRGATLPF